MAKITLMKAEMHIASFNTNDESRNRKKANTVNIRQCNMRKGIIYRGKGDILMTLIPEMNVTVFVTDDS